MTYEKEYQLKLETLFSEVKKELLKSKDKEFLTSELEDEMFNFLRDYGSGELIDMKKHGFKLIAMILNEVIKKC